MEVLFFDDHLEKFLRSLEKVALAKSLRTFDLLARFGSDLGMPHSKILGQGLFELRIRGVQEVRFLYCFHSGTAVILHGFIKKTQKIAHSELRIAITKKESLEKK